MASSTPHPQPSPEQQFVLSRHNEDKERLDDFVKQKWPCSDRQQNTGKVNEDDICCLHASTTAYSTVFVLSLGMKSVISYNSFSKDANNPWLITLCSVPQENPALAKYIREEWERIAAPGDPEKINLIAKHIIYDATSPSDIPQYVPLEYRPVDTVRTEIQDLTIWSHPQRDGPLWRVWKERREDGNEQNWQQMRGDLKATPQKLKAIMKNPNIPDRAVRVEEVKGQARDKIERLYKSLFPHLPDSFQWPTIQLEQKIQGQSQRHGGTQSGGLKSDDNESHNIFIAVGAVARNSMEAVFNVLVGQAFIDQFY